MTNEALFYITTETKYMNPDALTFIFAIIGLSFIICMLGWGIVSIANQIRDYIRGNRDEYITIEEHNEQIKVLQDSYLKTIENMKNEEKVR